MKLKFERNPDYEENARILKKTLADHEGYPRENDGSWIIQDADTGLGIITVRFQGKAKRGQAWNAPDPEGMAIARLIVEAVNTRKPKRG